MLYVFYVCFIFILIVKENFVEFRFELYNFFFFKKIKRGIVESVLWFVCFGYLVDYFVVKIYFICIYYDLKLVC